MADYRTEDYEGIRWFRVKFKHPNPEREVKTHLVHRSALTSLLSEGASRWQDWTPQVDEWPDLFLDYPGMIVVNRPIERMKIDSGEIVVASENVSDFLDEFRGLQLRRFGSGMEYYKLHTYMYAIVFTVGQKELVQEWLEKTEEGADIRALQFYKEWERKHLNTH